MIINNKAHYKVRKTRGECKAFFNAVFSWHNFLFILLNIGTRPPFPKHLNDRPFYPSMNATLLTETYNAHKVLQLRNRLMLSELERRLFEQSLFYVKKTLVEEFGLRFATCFEQQHPKAFYKLVKTTQTRLTWRPTPVELQLI